jgi:glycosyltransferase involved in cell wall biosynthesis
MSAPLTIGVDARELLGSATGVGRYLGELMRRWTARTDARQRRFVLYTPAALPLPLPPAAAEQKVIGTGTGTWWEQTALRRAVRADRPAVFFAPAYTAPLGIGVPLAVTIHDISFVTHPEWFRPREGLRRRWLTARAAAAASVVFTDSEFSRRELESRLSVPPERIEVISPGVTGWKVEGRSQEVEGRSQEVEGRSEEVEGRSQNVLFVGSLFNRRRLPDLITAFARATRDLPLARLVIVGADRTWPPQDLAQVAANNGVASRVMVKDYVSDAELETLYAEASVFAFLSEYEGFGLTPLEAMARGVPVVVLDTAVAREIYGDAAVYVPADDIHATADALRGFLEHPEAARAWVAKGPAILSRYSWDRAADRTLEHLERIAGR